MKFVKRCFVLLALLFGITACKRYPPLDVAPVNGDVVPKMLGKWYVTDVGIGMIYVFVYDKDTIYVVRYAGHIGIAVK
jgi:hypothetical protein